MDSRNVVVYVFHKQVNLMGRRWNRKFFPGKKMKLGEIHWNQIRSGEMKREITAVTVEINCCEE